MPTPLIKSYAEKSGKSIAEIEKIWDEAKSSAEDKFKHGTPRFWAYVNGIVKKRISLKESLSFKQFILEDISSQDKADALQVFNDWCYQNRVNFGFKDSNKTFNSAFEKGQYQTISLSDIVTHHDWGRRPDSDNPPIVLKLKSSNTGKLFIVLDGQHRIITAKEKGKTELNCFVLDIPIRYSKPTKKYLLDEN